MHPEWADRYLQALRMPPAGTVCPSDYRAVARRVVTFAARMTSLLAHIPSPSSGSFEVASHFTIHMYGVMLLIGIAGCIWLTGAAG